MATQDLGRITAYAEAVAGGYTGTREEFDLALSNIDNKVDKVTGKQLSTEDYSTADKTKLSGIAINANNYSLPVAGSTIGGVKSGTDITVDSSGNVSVNDDSHNHIIGNVDGLQSALDGKLSINGTAAAAVKASQDGSGNSIMATYASKLDIATVNVYCTAVIT